MLRMTLTAALLAAAMLTTTTSSTQPPQAESEIILVAARGCGGKATGFPNKWGPTSESNCGLLGSKNTRVYYSWAVRDAQGQRACVDGWGFDEANPKGRWFSLGCGTRGIDYGDPKGIPWGSVGAVPKIRVKSLNIPLGVQVSWSH